jgi:hypothetical protein
MSRWKRPARAIARRLRSSGIVPELKVPDYLKIMSGNAFVGVVLSIIPGFAHILAGRFREVWLWVPAWVVIMGLGIYFYGSSVGLLFLSFAVGIHSWIALSYSLKKEHADPGQNVVDFIMLFVALGLLYWGVRVFVLGDFVFGFSNMNFPYQKIQQGDTLLARRSGARAQLARGSFVIADFIQLNNYHTKKYNVFKTTGQVIAMPGERLEIAGDKFIVNGRELPVDKYPVPNWMSGAKFAQGVPGDCYFVSTNYNVNMAHGYGLKVTGDMISDACMIKKGAIDAVAVMRWFPQARRGFLKAEE